MVADGPATDGGFSRVWVLGQLICPFVATLRFGRQGDDERRTVQPVIARHNDDGPVLIELGPQRVAPEATPENRANLWGGRQHYSAGGCGRFVVGIRANRLWGRVGQAQPAPAPLVGQLFTVVIGVGQGSSQFRFGREACRSSQCYPPFGLTAGKRTSLLQPAGFAVIEFACAIAQASRTSPPMPAPSAVRAPAPCSSSFDLAAPERCAGSLNAGSLRGTPEATVVSNTPRNTQ